MASEQYLGGWTGADPLRFTGASSDPSRVFDVYDPATGAISARVAAADAEGVDEVVTRAREVYADSWKSVGPVERASLLRKVAAAIRPRMDEFAELESRDVGKPFEISRHYDMEVFIASFEFFAGQAHNLHGEFFPGGFVDTYTVPDPYGVVAGIIPFNWPPVHTAAKAAAALAAGNVIILKPPEQCPFSVIALVDAMNEVLPPGVVQVIPGDGATGAALVGHPGVDRLSFTGSPATARRVLASAAQNLTGALVELGGKNPIIVFDDADLDIAVPAAVEGTFFNSGEACTAGSRLLVHDSIADEFRDRFAQATSKLVTGDPLDASAHIGPMVTAQHLERVRHYIGVGRSEAAEIYSGSAPSDARLQGGYWQPPVLFDNVTRDMTIAQEEIFGPVGAIMRFSDDDEALDIANSTDFALVAALFGRGESRLRRHAQDMDAGVVFINNYNRAFLPTPFGGNRASGYGREHSAETIKEYLRSKSVRLPSGLQPIPKWSGAQVESHAPDGQENS